MVLQWLLIGLFVLASGLGILRGAVSLQSYALLALGVSVAAWGTLMMTRNRPFGPLTQ